MFSVNFINSLKCKNIFGELALHQMVSVGHVWILASIKERQATHREEGQHSVLASSPLGCNLISAKLQHSFESCGLIFYYEPHP
jgi:hypothetical protein